MVSLEEGTVMLREAALCYAAAGQPVFPVCPKGEDVKRPLVRWATEATTDPEQIRAWWDDQPHAIGLPTGVLVDVLDIDAKPGRPNGYVVLKLLDGLKMLDGAVRWVMTPSGGCHGYFPTCGDMPNVTYAKHGGDLRGKGGYVLAPPSSIETEEHTSSYRELEFTPAGAPAPLDWRRLDRLLVGKRKEHPVPRRPLGGGLGGRGHGSQRLLEALTAEVVAAPPGERNSTLFKKIAVALEYGLDTEPLKQAARARGLADVEISRTAQSAFKRVNGRRA